jgi:hypothetical protein
MNRVEGWGVRSTSKFAIKCFTCSGLKIPAPAGGDCAWAGGVFGGVECVEAAETLRERDVAVDCEALETFCRLRGGAIAFSCELLCVRCLETHTQFGDGSVWVGCRKLLQGHNKHRANQK